MLQKKQPFPFQDQKMKEEINKKMEIKEKGKQIPLRINNPLQDINGICRTNMKSRRSKSSSSSSSTISSASTSSVSVEAPKGCLQLLLSSDHTSSSRKPKSFTKFTKSATTPKSAPNLTRPRSTKPFHENDLLRPISQKTQKNGTFIQQWQSGTRPMFRMARRSNLSSDLASGSEEFSGNLKNLKQKERPKSGLGESIESSTVGNSLNSIENLTPINKLACGSGFDRSNFYAKHAGENSRSSGSNNAVKTPPVEASVSPEIQGRSSTVLISATTPVYYGAGHVLSGVTDKRKCKPRGILTVGGIIDPLGGAKEIFSDDGNVNEMLKESRPSLIPLPAEASMRWLLSPSNDNDEGKKVVSANKYTKLTGSLDVDDVASLPARCGSILDLSCDSDGSHASQVPDVPANSGKTRIALLSPRCFPEFEDLSGHLSEKLQGKIQFDSPRTSPSCKAIPSQDRRKYHNSLGEEISPLSIGSLSSGNVIQTPKSDSSSDKLVSGSWLKVNEHQRQTSKSELNLVTEILPSVNLSPGHMSLWDPLGLSSQFTDLNSPSVSVDLPHIQHNADTLASWTSNSSLDNVSHSQMRISWREGVVSHIFKMDELDCCKCLSDDDIDVDGCDDDQRKLQQFYEQKEIDPSLDSALGSPEYVEEETTIFLKRQEKLSPLAPGTSAESISTDCGGLAISGDSDWAFRYENHLFKV